MSTIIEDLLDQSEYKSKYICLQDKEVYGIINFNHCINTISLDCSDNQIKELINLPESLEILNCSYNSGRSLDLI